MTREEIAHLLIENHNSFLKYVTQLDEKEFLSAPADKWNAGQHLDHIRRAVKPLVQAFSIPHFILKRMLLKSNRPSISYDELVIKYIQKLEQGGRASGRFIPETITTSDKQKLISSVNELVKKLSGQLSRFTEKELDTYIIPHPLLKKLTIREMMYFTIYHVEHHHDILKGDQYNLHTPVSIELVN